MIGLHKMSLDNILYAYSELEDIYRNDHGWGGNIGEIYGYLFGTVNTLDLLTDYKGLTISQTQEFTQRATAFIQLVEAFKERRSVKVLIEFQDEEEYKEVGNWLLETEAALSLFSHRFYVKVEAL